MNIVAGFEWFARKWQSIRESYASDSKNGARNDALLGAALAYAMEGGGKFVRPKLCLMAASAVEPGWASAHDTGTGTVPSWRRELIESAAAAVEMVHNYSLIHDDLPCMDDDDLRRGRPTLHKVYNEATALLAGDALLTDAFAIISDVALPREHAHEALACVRELSSAAGGRGMVMGQALDLVNDGMKSLGRDEAIVRLEKIHVNKTGALLGAACAMGAASAGAGTDVIAAFRSAGHKLGLAFQVMDDLLDDSPNTGKTQGKDAHAGKLTYLDLLGRESGLRYVKDLTGEALRGLKELGVLTPAFEEFATALCGRKN